MKRDLIFSILLAAFFHIAVLFGEKLPFFKKGHAEKNITQQEVVLTAEVKEEEEEEKIVETNDQGMEELPEEFMAASLEEPPPSAIALGALVMTVRPDKPRPPRPDSSQSFRIATQAEKGVGTPGNTVKTLFDVSELDQVPKVNFAPEPKYPLNLKRSGTSGFVEAAWSVNEKGRVIADQIVILSSSHREFEPSIREALRQTVFQPGLVNGKPVQFKMKRKFEFNLSNER